MSRRSQHGSACAKVLGQDDLVHWRLPFHETLRLKSDCCGSQQDSLLGTPSLPSNSSTLSRKKKKFIFQKLHFCREDPQILGCSVGTDVIYQLLVRRQNSEIDLQEELVWGLNAGCQICHQAPVEPSLRAEFAPSS